MTTVHRRLGVQFTDPVGLAVFKRGPGALPFPVEHRYTTLADLTVDSDNKVQSVPNLGSAGGQAVPAPGAPSLVVGPAGLPFLRFDGVDDRLRSTALCGAGTTFPFTTYVVGRIRSATNVGGGYKSLVAASDAESGCINFNSTGTQNRLAAFRGGSGVGGTPTVTANPSTVDLGVNTWRTIAASYSEIAPEPGSTGTATFNVDGSDVYTANPVGSLGTTYLESGQGSQNYWADIDVYEFGYVGGTITAGQRAYLVEALRELYDLP
ncbi:hypothetical protein [Nocardioides ochotonae]|uniref:hypothetical protein n=1 Tax=Nocardioides ochotonae TaxID=2685869 RepID=UPI00140AA4AA|nr:hypothetical protein [Nocardioides ochotonae]